MFANKLPESVKIDGAEYRINTDFRAGIQFEQLMRNETPDWDAVLGLYYPDGCPENLESALEQILWFYRCGKEERSGRGSGVKARAYDLEHDFSYIYAAFLEQYRIDLYEIEHLHWWKFKALFEGLTGDCEICKIMEYRTIDLKDMDKERKKFYQKMKRLYALPTRTEEEKMRDDKISQILMNGGDIAGAIQRGEL